jgi:sec-independent protein translocase protein TatC
MCVCLFGVHKLVAILKWPLDRAAAIRLSTNQQVTVELGTNRLGTFALSTNQLGSLNLGTQGDVTLQLEPVQVGNQQLLGVRVVPQQTAPKGPELIFLDPASPFLSSLHLAFFGGLLLASPFVFYFVGQFVMPALKIREKKYFLRAVAIGSCLFFAGVFLAYFFVMPRALKFAEQFALWMGVRVLDWRAETYFSFVVKFMLGMGLGFELPVFLLALVKIGVLNYRKLASMRRYMIVGNLIIGALLTTPEVYTQVIMAVVLQALYEVSVWIAWYWERQQRRRAALSAGPSLS